MPEIHELLAAPFDPREVKWKPQMVKQNRCLAIAYIDARLVMDRLDDELGSFNWKTSYEVLADGSVICTLSIRLPGTQEWVSKQDVGSLSEQPDAGDRLKAAFSDALKRAAVQFGIGRYLYRLPHQWVDYDPNKKMIVQIPRLPDWAIPGKQVENGRHQRQPAEYSEPSREKADTTSTVVDESIVNHWKKFLATQPTIDLLNASLGDYYAINCKYTRRAVITLIKTYAASEGMEWSSEAQKYVPPVDQPQSDSAIPF